MELSTFKVTICSLNRHFQNGICGVCIAQILLLLLLLNENTQQSSISFKNKSQTGNTLIHPDTSDTARICNSSGQSPKSPKCYVRGDTDRELAIDHKVQLHLVSVLKGRLTFSLMKKISLSLQIGLSRSPLFSSRFLLFCYFFYT